MANTSDFDGRHVVITGAAGDIGRLACVAFLSAGARVWGIDRGASASAALSTTLGSAASRFEYMSADLADPANIQSLADTVRTKAGRVDVLINNAGLLGLTPILQTSVEEWDRLQAVNLRAAFLMIKAMAPLLAEPSVILNVSSAAALRPGPGSAAYSVSKAGLITLSKVAAMELAPRTRVNAICPGPLNTQMPQNYLKDHPLKDQINAGMIASTLLKRFGEPGEIVDLLVFLAGPKSAYITGAVFAADGGFTA